MPVLLTIHAWRRERRQSVETIATKARIATKQLELIESGETDPPASMIVALANAIGVPISWLFHHPSSVKALLTDSDNEPLDEIDSPDQITERMLCGAQQDRELYLLLTTLLQEGDPNLLRAAEANLRSLVKQARRSTIPWQSRPSGHFEPPSD
jgi:transcriptional regulator with XRE-family HTH domain|tara:strand:+ start:2007 stop:2468 length:462 start_codon:yes stop_codon:yes gene_type:complete